jgi:biopolymer transport protein ExbB
MKLLLYLQSSAGNITQPGNLTDSIDSVEATEKTVSILDLLFEGGWYIIVPLFILSIYTVIIFIERNRAINRALKEEQHFMDKIKDYITDGKLDSAKNLCATTPSPVARMLEKGIKKIGKPIKDIAASIENVGKLEVYSLERNLSGLATIAGAAPMLGFLGTVIGMVQVFLSMESTGSVDVNAIAGGTKVAMMTTIVGLIVGIIAYVAYNYLVARVTKAIAKMEATSIDFLDILDEPGK